MDITTITQLPILHESNFAFLYFDENHRIIYHRYKDNSTTHMTDEDYKTELLAVIKNCLETQAISLIADTKNFEFGISPTLQKWTDENIFAKHKYLKKCAVLLSEDLIGQLGLEQVLDKSDEIINSISFETKFFSNMQEAIAWVLI